jgi:branched-chain amino acid transport system permease protein
VLESLQQYFTQKYGASQAYLIIYGALFLIVVLLLPRGVIPGIEELVERWRARSTPPEQPGPEDPGRTGDIVKAAGVR